MTDYDDPDNDSRFIGPERTLISAILADAAGRCWGVEELDTLTPQDFYDRRLGALYALMLERHTAGRGTDGASLVPHLARMAGHDARPFTASDLIEMATTGYSATFTSVGGYAREVVEAAHLRALDTAGARIRELVRADVPFEDAFEMARSEVDGAAAESTNPALTLEEQHARTLEILSTKSTFRPTPWAALNDLIGGWKPGALYIVGARPGVGKTLFGAQAGLSMAEHGWAGFNTLEMTKHEMQLRIIAHLARIPLQALLHHNLSEEQWGRVRSLGPNVLSKYRLSVDDRSDVRPAQVRNHARSLARRGELTGMVLDYIGLMPAARGDRRERRDVVTDYSRSLKMMAKELAIPVVALSQLNREGMSRKDRRPVLEDLRESGSLEQDADVVILLSVDWDAPDYLTVHVAKHRNGPTGEFVLERQGAYSTLADSDMTPAEVMSRAADKRAGVGIDADW